MKTIQYTFLFLTLWVFIACDLDVNDNPNAPTEASATQLIANAELSIIGQLAGNTIGGFSASVVQTRISSRFDSYDVYADQTNAIWEAFYAGILKDLEVAIEQSTENEAWHHVGLAEILKAYAYSILVDLFGDVTYTDALKPSLSTYGFDNGSDIYPKLFDLINQGITNLEKKVPKALLLGSEDHFYQGNVKKWIKFAKSLQFKLYNQIRLVDPSQTKKNIQSLIDKKGLMESSEDDFKFTFGSSALPDTRMPLFREDYEGRINNRIAQYFYDLLEELNDPRIPYYFYNQAGVFVGLDAGQPSVVASYEDQDRRTFHGIYPAGGAYDEGQAVLTNVNMGLKGAGTFRMLTYASHLYTYAEAVLALDVSGDAKALFKKAMEESFYEVNRLPGVPQLSATQISDYVDARLIAYDATTEAAAKIAMVVEQKYIYFFGNGFEQFNDWRRTDVPQGLILESDKNKKEVDRTPPLLRLPYPGRITVPDGFESETTSPIFWDIN